MTTAVLVSPEEYLATSYDGLDREYVRGVVVERTMPTFTHGETQNEIGHEFRLLRDSHALFPCVETRMELAPDLYRIPDVAVFAGRRPAEVPNEPPLVAIEVVSPDDRLHDILKKLDEYLDWGVPHIWLVDPAGRQFHVYGPGGLSAVQVLTLPGYPVDITKDKLFGR